MSISFGENILPVLGTEVEILFRSSETGGQYTLYRCTVPPAGGPPPHRHDFDEAFYLLEGQLEILNNGVTTIVKTGERAFVARGAVHTFRNASDTPATYLGIATPAGHERFFEEAAQLAVPFDFADVFAVCERNGIELIS